MLCGGNLKEIILNEVDEFKLVKREQEFAVIHIPCSSYCWKSYFNLEKMFCSMCSKDAPQVLLQTLKLLHRMNGTKPVVRRVHYEKV